MVGKSYYDIFAFNRVGHGLVVMEIARSVVVIVKRTYMRHFLAVSTNADTV